MGTSGFQVIQTWLRGWMAKAILKRERAGSYILR
jgi:hypothetical protein